MARICPVLLLFLSGICVCWSLDHKALILPVSAVHGPMGGLRIVTRVRIGNREADFIMDTTARVTSLSFNCTHGSKEVTMFFDRVEDSFLPFPGTTVDVSGIDIVCKKKKSNVAALGSSNSSLPFQLASATGLPYRFAYCISHDDFPGRLFFGKTSYYVYWFGLIETSRWVELAHIPLMIAPSGAYQLNLTGIGIGMKSILRGGGEIIQVGTSTRYTSLPSKAYKLMRKQFIKEAASKKIKRLVSTSFGELDLCYNMNSIQRRSLSNVTLVFNNGVEWIVAPNNYLIPKMGAQNVLCFAFVSAGKGPSIIGTFQQEEQFIEYDLENKMLGVSGNLLLTLNRRCAGGT